MLVQRSQYKLCAQFLRLCGHQSMMSDAHRASANRLQNQIFRRLLLFALEQLRTLARRFDASGLGITEFPARVLWWRRHAETRVRHRNPLFTRQLGVVSSDFCIDRTHTVYLGCLNTFVAVAFWRCVRPNVFAVEGTDEEVLQNTCLHLRANVFAYFLQGRAQRRATVGDQ